MKQLNYLLRMLWWNRGDTLVKMLSVGLGMAVSAFLFVRVAYDQSFDTCFKDYDNIMQLWMEYELDGKKLGRQEHCVGKLGGGVADAIPDMVEAGSATRNIGSLFRDHRELSRPVLTAERDIFDILGIEMLQGDLKEFDNPESIYISDRLADEAFGNENPVGEKLLLQNSYEVTVRGVYRGWGDESTISDGAIFSFKALCRINGFEPNWMGGDSWATYIRVKPGTDLGELNRRIHEVVKQNVPDTVNFSIEAWAEPLRDTYRGYDNIKQIDIVLSILAGAILIISALNYVLLSVASLSRRAKAIGVHKCSGAGSGEIFGQFLWETGIIFIGGIAVMAAIYFLVRYWAGNMLMSGGETLWGSMMSAVSLSRLWVVAAVVVLVFVIAAIIPARMFSSIPVSQVFRRVTEHRNRWKNTLLFIEFAGIALVGGLLVVVGRQYSVLTDAPLGYNPDRVVVISNYASEKTREKFVDYYRALPFVEDLTWAHGYPSMGYSGDFIYDGSQKPLFSSKYDYFADNYLGFMEMTLLDGRMPEAGSETEIAVNQEFCRQMGWDEKNAMGKIVYTSNGPCTVTGLLRDFRTASYYLPQQPFMARITRYPAFIYLKLKEPFDQNRQRLDAAIAETFPGESIFVRSLPATITDAYAAIALFEKFAAIAGCVLSFIAIIGMMGYLRDEIRRRSREIAIRKVNGAGVADIIALMGVNIMKMAVPSVILGTVAAWLFSRPWLEQFTVTLDNIPGWFMLSAMVILAVILLLTVLLTYRAAVANPVTSLKAD